MLTSLVVTATFNEAVSGTPTIAIDATGTADLPATSMTDSGDQTTFIFSYDVPAGSDGAATVTIAGAADVAGNPNDAASNDSFTIDNTSPTVALSYSKDPVRDADTLVVTATFNEAVTGTPTIAIDVAGTADLPATSMTDSGDQTTFTFSYDVPAGSDGSATVTIEGATDSAGNPNAAASNNSFTIDNSAPTVASSYSTDPVRDADTLVITATFNEAVTGTPTISIDVVGTADLSATSMTDSGDQTTFTFSYDVPVGSDGSATVTIAGAADSAGNPNAAASNDSFTIDNSAPTVALSYSKDPVRDADTLVITATFNEAVSGTPTIAIDVVGTADLSATSMTDSWDQTTFTFSYDVPVGSDGSATVTIAGAADAAGNPNDAASNDSFTIDNSAPTVALAYSKDPVKDADTLVVTATFNEAVSGTPTIAIDVAGTADLPATSMTDSGGQTIFTFSYDVPASSDGSATVTIAGATDSAGNTNAAASNDSFTIDNTAPTVALAYSKDPVRDADTLVVTATFNEAVSGTPTIAIDATGTADLPATSMTDSGDQTTFTFSYDVPAGSDGAATVTISGAADSAGNPNAAASNDSFTIDNTSPTVALAYSKDPVRDADTLVITATFNEAVTGTPTIAIDVVGTADLSAISMADSGDQTTFTFSYDVPAGSDGSATVTIAGTTDSAGNPNDGGFQQLLYD